MGTTFVGQRLRSDGFFKLHHSVVIWPTVTTSCEPWPLQRVVGVKFHHGAPWLLSTQTVHRTAIASSIKLWSKLQPNESRQPPCSQDIYLPHSLTRSLTSTRACMHASCCAALVFSSQVCSPTRTAIMTGRYPHRNGMQTPFCGGMAEGLNLNETLMSEYMNRAGYTSRIVGKW